MSTLKVNTIDSHSGSTLTIDGTADVAVASSTSATSNTTGALKVTGGISTQENLYVGGNAVITGTMTANGGTITLGDADTDNVNFGGEVNSDIIPDATNLYDLGSATKKWAEVHATTFTGSAALSGTPTAPTAAANTNTTQIATTAYVQTEITDLIGGAPGALDTLNELAAAINDDSSYASTVTTSLGGKVGTSSAQALGSAADVLTISDHTITLARGDGTTDTVVVPDNNDNTTYSAGSGLDLTSTTFSVEPDLRDGITHVGLDTGDYIGWTNNSHQSFFVNAGERARIEADGDFHADGDVIAYSTTISDERLKTGILPITNALDKVNQLKGCTFTYTADGKKSAGLIAQDVEKVLPTAVSEKELPLKTNDGETYKVLQYDQTIGLLVEAIKELTDKVNKLEEK